MPCHQPHSAIYLLSAMLHGIMDDTALLNQQPPPSLPPYTIQVACLIVKQTLEDRARYFTAQAYTTSFFQFRKNCVRARHDVSAIYYAFTMYLLCIYYVITREMTTLLMIKNPSCLSLAPPIHLYPGQARKSGEKCLPLSFPGSHCSGGPGGEDAFPTGLSKPPRGGRGGGE